MYKHQVEVYIYIYEHVFQKIGHETSSKVRRLSGKKSPYKILNLSAFSGYIMHTSSNDAHGNTSLPKILYIAVC